MEALPNVLKYTGFGGLSLLIFLLLFQRLISRSFLTQLDQKNTYKIVNKMISVIFKITIVSAIIYLIIRMMDIPARHNSQFNKAVQKNDSIPTKKINTGTIKDVNNSGIQIGDSNTQFIINK